MSFIANKLSCSVGNQWLFQRLSFTVNKGQLITVSGPNGCGKTTLLSLLAGLKQPQRGEIRYQGDKMSYLSHKDSLKSNLTVTENIAYQLRLAKVPTLSCKMDQLLETFALKAKKDTLCRFLSQGQRRKVALIALLLKQTSLWILDEPFTALDDKSVATFTEFFKAHLDAGGIIVMASHQPLICLQSYNQDLRLAC